MSFSDRKVCGIHPSVCHNFSYIQLFQTPSHFLPSPEEVYFFGDFPNQNGRYVFDFISRTTVCEVARLARNVPLAL